LAEPDTAARLIKMIRIAESDLRAVRSRHGGTSHDVLLAILTGGLRHWLSTRGELARRPALRALIPVNRRRGTACADTMGNLLSGYLCDLPVDEPDPIRRLALVQAAMDRNKSNGPLRGAGAFPVLAGLMPRLALRMLTPLVSSHAGALFDLVITTVRVPSVPLSVCGAPVAEVYPLVPLAPGQALGVALCHYKDNVHIGFAADPQALPDLDKLLDAVDSARLELTDIH